MFRINEVLKVEDKLFRVLMVLERDIVWINLDDESSFPNWIGIEELERFIDDEKLERVDPFEELMYLSAEEGSTNQIKRDKNFELIRPLIEEPEY